MNYIKQHLRDASEIINQINQSDILKIIDIIRHLKSTHGRLFFLGVGGSAANCSHAVNDFRKIVGIESYAPTDNVSELTARTNDEGWDSVFVEWLKISRLTSQDCLFVLSVGGGDTSNNISPNLVKALKYGQAVGSKIVGIVGRNGGFTISVADACVLIPTINADAITPHAEAFQAVIWHLIVSHPALKAHQTKWESSVK